jgi:broad specificity phosphatase PhoE
MRIIVVRHYKTLINVARQIMGWGDAPRAANWEGDLSYVDGVLRKLDVSIDDVYSSCLERARRTAMYYAQSRRIHLVRDSEELNEINYGPILYKKSKRWVAKHYPQHKVDPDFVYPEGESFLQMQRRSIDFVLSLAASRPSRTALLVVHAGVIRGLVCHFLGLDYADNLKRKISHRYIGDFEIAGGHCQRYTEHGRPSGFVKDGIVSIPWVDPEPDASEPVQAHAENTGVPVERVRADTGT